MSKHIQTETKHVIVYVSEWLTNKGKGIFKMTTPNVSLRFGLREARTVYATLRNFFIPPNRRGKLY
jgi:hypothetical protein